MKLSLGTRKSRETVENLGLNVFLGFTFCVWNHIMIINENPNIEGNILLPK